MEEKKGSEFEEKDPMRDSLMSDSDDQEENDDFDDINDRCDHTHDESSCPNSLDLEMDMWQGQFDFSATNCGYDSVFTSATRSGVPYFKDMMKSVHMLQQQVGVLAENQVNTDDRYTRVKQDNSALQARIMMLEEQLRETEMRGEDRLSDEQKRNKELMARVEREKQLTIENYSMKYASVEKDKKILTEENQRLNNQLEKLHKDKLLLEDRVSEAEFTSSATQQENSKLGEMSRRDKEELRIERERGSQVIEELRCEVERLRAVEESYRKRSSSVDSHSGTSSELLTELKKVKDENKQLLEQVEELEAQLLTMRLEEGRTLVSSAATSNSLAAEFEQMTSDEDAQYSGEIDKLRNSLIDAQEANQHLRSYIDGILLTIVENYPQLLEVKQK